MRYASEQLKSEFTAMIPHEVAEIFQPHQVLLTTTGENSPLVNRLFAALRRSWQKHRDNKIEAPGSYNSNNNKLSR